MRLRSLQELQQFAKQAKIKSARHEVSFAKLLRKFKISYNRQKIIVCFIVDFYLPDRNLIVEIDGPIHLNRANYDGFRDNCLKTWGWDIIHITWAQFTSDYKECIERVLAKPSTKKNRQESKLRLNRINKAYHEGNVVLNDPLEEYSRFTGKNRIKYELITKPTAN